MTASPQRTVATIDIGTNSVLLLVARVEGTDLTPIEERATITRLGQGVDKTRELASDAIDRTLACLSEYAGIIRNQGVGRVDVVGTSAMRDAAGSDDFRRRAREILGVEPRTISGEEEARLTFRGGLSGLVVPAGPVVVFDIGGGSTEFIRGDGATRVQRDGVSLDVGSVRLTERHVRSDPPTRAELDAVASDVQRAMAPLASLTGATLVGVAGTVTTIAAIAGEVEPYDASRVHGTTLGADEVARVAELLSTMPLVDRMKLPGLSPKRADVIVAGALLCSAIMRRAEVSSLLVSDRGVRWGLADELARNWLH